MRYLNRFGNLTTPLLRASPTGFAGSPATDNRPYACIVLSAAIHAAAAQGCWYNLGPLTRRFQVSLSYARRLVSPRLSRRLPRVAP